MAKRRNPRRKRVRRKLTGHSEHAPLAALAPVITEKQIFEPIHRRVLIPQKTVDYRPTDKLVFAVVGIDRPHYHGVRIPVEAVSDSHRCRQNLDNHHRCSISI